jgi:hypothetical protein
VSRPLGPPTATLGGDIDRAAALRGLLGPVAGLRLAGRHGALDGAGSRILPGVLALPPLRALGGAPVIAARVLARALRPVIAAPASAAAHRLDSLAMDKA